MEYAANGLANAASAQNAYAGYQQGIGGALGGVKAAEVPRTIASAASRLDGLNDRLAKISESLSMISGQIGSLNGVANSAGDNSKAPSCGAVGRLNDAADAAHRSLSEIEQLISGIGRALG